MISVEHDMNTARQLRKIDARIADAPSLTAAAYLAYLRGLMLASIALGVPQPASNFLPAYEEEFGD